MNADTAVMKLIEAMQVALNSDKSFMSFAKTMKRTLEDIRQEYYADLREAQEYREWYRSRRNSGPWSEGLPETEGK